jgi:hypothetical protein
VSNIGTETYGKDVVGSWEFWSSRYSTLTIATPVAGSLGLGWLSGDV